MGIGEQFEFEKTGQIEPKGIKMKKYHKIQTIFKRDKNKKIIIGDWTLPEFEFLQNNIWNWDEKVDGMNIRIGWDTSSVTIDGRNENSSIPSFLANYLFKKFTTEKFQEHFPATPITIYGEGFGYGIQGKMGAAYAKCLADSYSSINTKQCEFRIFDIKIGDFWLESCNILDIAHKFNTYPVPTLGTGTINEAIEFVKNGFTSQMGEINAEGLILRPFVEMTSRKGERIITKIKERDFDKNDY